MSDKTQSPEFKSNIPSHLMENCSPQERWIMESIDILKQSSDFTLKNQAEQGRELEKQNIELAAIKEQVLKTNGKVLKHEGILQEFSKNKDELIDIITTKQNMQKVFSSKWFYVALALVVVGIISVVKDHSLTEWLKAFIS